MLADSLGALGLRVVAVQQSILDSTAPAVARCNRRCVFQGSCILSWSAAHRSSVYAHSSALTVVLRQCMLITRHVLFCKLELTAEGESLLVREQHCPRAILHVCISAGGSVPQYFICFVLFCISACWTASDNRCGGHNDTGTTDHF